MAGEMEFWATVGSLGGVVVGVIGFFVLVRQLGQVNRALRVNAQAAIYAQGSDARRALVDYPQVRPFIFGGRTIPADSEHYERALTVAEMFLAYYEHTLINGAALARGDAMAWRQFVVESLERSPLMISVLRERRQFYSEEMRALAMPGAHSVERAPH